MEHPAIMKLEKVKRLGLVQHKARKQPPDKVWSAGKEKDAKCAAEKPVIFRSKEEDEVQLKGFGITGETDRMR